MRRRDEGWYQADGAGARKLPLSCKAAYLLASPLVPFLLLARMALRVSRKHCRMDKFARSLPLLITALIVYVAGGCIGYVAGPGDALLKVE
ncbi:MAG: hypothetical protein ABSD56_02855 [Bryobacteraceae bacterium]